MDQTQLQKIDSNKYQSLLQDVEELNQIQTNLLSCISEQSEQISRIEDNITYTDMYVEAGTNSLKIVDKYFFNYTPILVGGTIGALVGGPIGVAMHLKLGSLLTIGGGVLGSMCGYKIQKI